MNAADMVVRAETLRRVRRGAPWFGGAVAIAIVFGVCHRPDHPAPIPQSLATQLEQHAIATAVDTAELHRLARVAAVATAAKDSAVRAARRADVAAAVQHRRADSLAAIATAADLIAQQSPTQPDSTGIKWHNAYDARTLEADSLRAAGAEKDAALQALAVARAVTDSARARAEMRAARADAVIASAVAVVRASDPPCRVAHFFGCPSRTASLIGGGLLGAAAVVASHALLHVP